MRAINLPLSSRYSIDNQFNQFPSISVTVVLLYLLAESQYECQRTAQQEAIPDFEIQVTFGACRVEFSPTSARSRRGGQAAGSTRLRVQVVMDRSVTERSRSAETELLLLLFTRFSVNHSDRFIRRRTGSVLHIFRNTDLEKSIS